jgi:hypothetical protein
MSTAISPDVIFLGLTAKDLLIAGGWFFTIVGWLVSNSQATSREKRKEARAEIDACIKLLGELVLKSRAYFGAPAVDALSKSRAAEIRFELQRLIARVERLEGKHAQFDVTGACGELLDAITNDPFESASRTELDVDSDLLMKIESDTHLLIDQLEDGFMRTFC